jgi:hypothetical protein
MRNQDRVVGIVTMMTGWITQESVVRLQMGARDTFNNTTLHFCFSMMYLMTVFAALIVQCKMI